MRFNQREILNLLDDAYMLPVSDCERFVDLMLGDDEVLLDLAQAFREGRITRHTFNMGVIDRVSEYFREELQAMRHRRAN